MVFIGVAVDGHASVVGDGPRHGRYAHDDARRRVVTQDGVRGVAAFPSATKDKDLPVAHRHAATLLRDKGHGLKRPPEDNTAQAAHLPLTSLLKVWTTCIQ